MAANTTSTPATSRQLPKVARSRLPHHEHTAIEQTFVLEGSFAEHLGVCHDAWTDEGCLMLAILLKPNTFFD